MRQKPFKIRIQALNNAVSAMIIIFTIKIKKMAKEHILTDDN
jgi:hypothetical protein